MKKFLVLTAFALVCFLVMAIYAPYGRMEEYDGTTIPVNMDSIPTTAPMPPITTIIPTTLPTVPIETMPTVPPTEPETEPTAPPTEEPQLFEIKMSFTGDMMLASYKDYTSSGNFNDYANKNEATYFLEKVREVFEYDDFTIVNLENVFSDRNLTPVEKDHDPAFWFKSKTSNVDILTSSSVEGVSLSNNHTFDYGQAGYEDTVKAVTDAGLQYGYGSNIMYFEKNGFRIAVICHGLWWEDQADNIIKKIKQAEEHSDFQVVFFHGGTEKLHKPENWKVRAAHKLVDNGADLVIGSHPHVLQPKEIYNGVEIVYSLGNFCYGGHNYPENRTIIYQFILNVNENMEVEWSYSHIIPCYVYTGNKNNFQPAIIEDNDEINRVLSFMDGILDSPL